MNEQKLLIKVTKKMIKILSYMTAIVVLLSSIGNFSGLKTHMLSKLNVETVLAFTIIYIIFKWIIIASLVASTGIICYYTIIYLTNVEDEYNNNQEIDYSNSERSDYFIDENGCFTSDKKVSKQQDKTKEKSTKKNRKTIKNKILQDKKSDVWYEEIEETVDGKTHKIWFKRTKSRSRRKEE